MQPISSLRHANCMQQVELVVRSLSRPALMNKVDQTGGLYPGYPGSIMVIAGWPTGVIKTSINRTSLLERFAADIGMLEGM